MSSEDWQKYGNEIGYHGVRLFFKLLESLMIGSFNFIKSMFSMFLGK
ncbi:hypothetical protein GYA19_04280 [Candidatus Beckwithbacteria bacterium]|nr:hypothetical protein [Candidatus Beckwithbacteria bacterium]